MGMFTGVEKEALLLLGCYHKDKNYTPSDAIDTAFKRAKAQQADKAGKHERQITGDL